MNVYLLEQIKMAIEAEPAQFIMEGFFSTEDGLCGDVPRHVPNCGTAACIAGWAATLSNRSPTTTPAKERARIHRSAASTYDIASRRIGLNDEQAQRLFYTDAWPGAFLSRWDTDESLEGRARIACDRIDHFIATDGAE